MSDWVKEGYTNGCVGLIVHNGKIVYHRAAGYDDLERKHLCLKMQFFGSPLKQKLLPA